MSKDRVQVQKTRTTNLVKVSTHCGSGDAIPQKKVVLDLNKADADVQTFTDTRVFEEKAYWRPGNYRDLYN